MVENLDQLSEDRIIIYPEIRAFGGMERVLLAFSKFLHEQGLNHRVICYYDHIDLSTYADWPIQVEVLQPKNNVISKSRALAKRIGKPRHRRFKPLLFGLQAANHAGMAGLRNYFIHIADTPSLLGGGSSQRSLVGILKKAKRDLFLKLARRGLARADAIAINAQYLADELEQVYGVKSKAIYVGGKAPPSTLPTAPPNDKSSVVRLLSISRLEWNKRIEWLIDVVCQLNSSGTIGDVCLELIGTGSMEKKFMDMARDKKLAPRQIVFRGFVSDDEIELAYSRASLFVMPAIQGFGLPALEALYRRVPVVMHKESGISEILSDTPWVEIFDGGIEGLVTSIETMVERIQKEQFSAIPVPDLPTEESFARELTSFCGWDIS